jgi:hypothetical protein
MLAGCWHEIATPASVQMGKAETERRLKAYRDRVAAETKAREKYDADVARFLKMYNDANDALGALAAQVATIEDAVQQFLDNPSQVKLDNISELMEQAGPLIETARNAINALPDDPKATKDDYQQRFDNLMKRGANASDALEAKLTPAQTEQLPPSPFPQYAKTAPAELLSALLQKNEPESAPQSQGVGTPPTVVTPAADTEKGGKDAGKTGEKEEKKEEEKGGQGAGDQPPVPKDDPSSSGSSSGSGSQGPGGSKVKIAAEDPGMQALRDILQRLERQLKIITTEQQFFDAQDATSSYDFERRKRDLLSRQEKLQALDDVMVGLTPRILRHKKLEPLFSQLVATCRNRLQVADFKLDVNEQINKVARKIESIKKQKINAQKKGEIARARDEAQIREEEDLIRKNIHNILSKLPDESAESAFLGKLSGQLTPLTKQPVIKSIPTSTGRTSQLTINYGEEIASMGPLSGSYTSPAKRIAENIQLLPREAKDAATKDFIQKVLSFDEQHRHEVWVAVAGVNTKLADTLTKEFEHYPPASEISTPPSSRAPEAPTRKSKRQPSPAQKSVPTISVAKLLTEMEKEQENVTKLSTEALSLKTVPEIEAKLTLIEHLFAHMGNQKNQILRMKPPKEQIEKANQLLNSALIQMRPIYPHKYRVEKEAQAKKATAETLQLKRVLESSKSKKETAQAQPSSDIAPTQQTILNDIAKFLIFSDLSGQTEDSINQSINNVQNKETQKYLRDQFDLAQRVQALQSTGDLPIESDEEEKQLAAPIQSGGQLFDKLESILQKALMVNPDDVLREEIRDSIASAITSKQLQDPKIIKGLREEIANSKITDKGIQSWLTAQLDLAIRIVTTGKGNRAELDAEIRKALTPSEKE